MMEEDQMQIYNDNMQAMQARMGYLENAVTEILTHLRPQPQDG